MSHPTPETQVFTLPYIAKVIATLVGAVSLYVGVAGGFYGLYRLVTLIGNN